MAAAVVLAPVLAYFPASFASYTYRDDSGREVTAEGREALLLERENQGEFQGEITEEVLTAALKRYQDFADGYEADCRTAFMMNVWRPVITMKKCPMWTDF